jgi:formyltetrahydrofolate deformylase
MPITGVLFRAGANVTSNHEFVDAETQRFFMRTACGGPWTPAPCVPPCWPPSRGRLRAGAAGSAAPHRGHGLARAPLPRGPARPHAYRELGAQLLAVVSNHANLRPLADKFGVPFHHVPHEGVSREAHEEALLALIGPMGPDYIVLAKYMRILSPGFVAAWPTGSSTSTTRSFPPSVGARPYHQAFRRGVKVIGATSHFVSDQLDEGPIIMQQVIPMDHSYTPHDLARAGRDIERTVLANSLKLLNEDRVFLCDNRTIIFD